MFYQHKGFPQINEIVLCRVTKIYPNSVFVELLEYERKSGIIHISEVSPGRIRNLRDYVSVGRQIVCKILRLDVQRGHIDLSLRRVNSNQRREKLDDIKQELKAEQLVKNLAKKLKKKPEVLYKQLIKDIFKEYSHLYLCFRDIVEEDLDLTTLGIDTSIANEIKEAVIEKFKPKQISIQGELTLKTYDKDGVEKIKKTLKSIQEVSDTISLFYLGAGRFKLTIVDFEYKPAEINLAKALEILEKFNSKLSTSSFERDKE